MNARFLRSLSLLALSFCLSAALISCATAESRIIGGIPVDIKSVPHLVSVRYKHNSSLPFKHRCSATIYSADILLTTARCVVGLKSQQLQIVAGSSYRSQNSGYVALVNSIIIHPDFNIWFIDNDLAILRLKIPLSKSDLFAIAPIALSRTLPLSDTVATIAGWGAMNEKGANAEQLQEGTVRLVSEVACKKVYGEGRISEAMLCAGDGSGIVIDACQGDAGSTLVSNGVAVGLVSWGSGCGRAGYPGVYTNLVHFKQWIENVVEQQF